jgi:hypothetical protein
MGSAVFEQMVWKSPNPISAVVRSVHCGYEGVEWVRLRREGREETPEKIAERERRDAPLTNGGHGNREMRASKDRWMRVVVVSVVVVVVVGVVVDWKRGSAK